MQKHPTRRPDLAVVDGWPINIATLDEAVETITEAASRGDGFSVFTLNLDHLVKLRHEESFRAAYERADFVTADGAPVAALARRQAGHVERATGADLVEPLAHEAARARLPVFLFGTTPAALKAAEDHLQEATQGKLRIAGSFSPPLGFDPQGPQADQAIKKIKASGAKLCFVALGAPKQELFAARAREQGVKCGFICIGAALDFLAGMQRRAPKLAQNLNIEWLWRLVLSPRRLAHRYALCALVLADIIFLKRSHRGTAAPATPDVSAPDIASETE